MSTAELFASEPATGGAPVVVGLDLSLTATGYAGPDGTKVIRSTGHKGDTLTQRSHRLNELVYEIMGATVANQVPALVLIEAPSFGQNRQGGTHDRAGLWWLVIQALVQDNALDVIEVPPATLKRYITGKGNADKPDIRMAIYKRFDVDIRDDNEADAFALRALGLDLLGHPLTQMPTTHRVALEKLPRPTVRGAA